MAFSRAPLGPEEYRVNRGTDGLEDRDKMALRREEDAVDDLAAGRIYDLRDAPHDVLKLHSFADRVVLPLVPPDGVLIKKSRSLQDGPTEPAKEPDESIAALGCLRVPGDSLRDKSR